MSRDSSPPDDAPLRLAVIGAGSIVRTRHLPGWHRIPGLTITGVANRSEASARAFVEAHAPEARVFPDWLTLIEEAEADIIWIGTTPHLHAACTVAALESGRHVFCQARMACTVAEARLMLEAAQKAPALVTMLCPPPYGLAEDAWVRQVLSDPALGVCQSLHLRSLLGSAADPQTPAHWRQLHELSGKNTMTLGIFAEILQRWFGPIERVAAQSRLLTPVRGGVAVTIPDLLQVQVVWASGLLGQWEFSCVYPGPPTQDLEVVFSEGRVRFDFESGRLWRQWRGQQEEELVPPPGLLRPWQVEEDFIHAVRHPEAPRPRPNFVDGLAYMQVVEAVWEARLTGRQVAVALF